MNQIILMGNNLNVGVNEDLLNNNCKTVKLLYKGEFIQNLDIYRDDKFYSIINKVKSILFKAGKVIYRRPLPNEVIERQSSDETLEYLLDRGVMVNHPKVVIINESAGEIRAMAYNFFNIRDGGSFQVVLGLPLLGAGITNLEFADIDKVTKTKN